MRKYYPQIVRQLISPQPIIQQKLGFLDKYLQNRKLIKECKTLWPQFSHKNILLQGPSLYSRLRASLKLNDQLQLLSVCSIPLYQKLKAQKVSLQQRAYKIQLSSINKVMLNKLNHNDRNREWYRVFLVFHHFQDGKTYTKKHCIQRKVELDNQILDKKWYFSMLDI